MAFVADWSPDLGDLWWPIAAVSSLFVFESFWALLVNGLFLWLFAKSLEDGLGRVTFLCLFVLGGVAAAAGQVAVDPDTAIPAVGLAGSVAALIGAYAVIFTRARILCWVLIPFFVTFAEVPAIVLALIWLLLQAIPAVGEPSVAGLAAGLAFGVLAGWVLRGRASRLSPAG